MIQAFHPQHRVPGPPPPLYHTPLQLCCKVSLQGAFHFGFGTHKGREYTKQQSMLSIHNRH